MPWAPDGYPGKELDVTPTGWPSSLGVDYTFTVRLVGDDGLDVWQQTGQPFGGYFPTSWWRPGRTMYDRYRILLPASLAPGAYWLAVSATDAGTGRPLPATGPGLAGQPGSLAIGPIPID